MAIFIFNVSVMVVGFRCEWIVSGRACNKRSFVSPSMAHSTSIGPFTSQIAVIINNHYQEESFKILSSDRQNRVRNFCSVEIILTLSSPPSP
jgi:hypothetical protein